MLELTLELVPVSTVITGLSFIWARINESRMHTSPESGCSCRKPKPGMVTTVAKKHGIDLARSFMVDDLASDCQAGKAAGVGKTIKVGEPTEHADFHGGQPG